MRFAGAASFGLLLIFTILLLKDWVHGNLVFWLSYLVSYGAATSGLLLYRKTFIRLFPPQLQRGTPHFVTLSLQPPHQTRSLDHLL